MRPCLIVIHQNLDFRKEAAQNQLCFWGICVLYMYDLSEKHLPNVKCGGNADDHLLYLAFNPREIVLQDEIVENLQKCIAVYVKRGRGHQGWLTHFFMKIFNCSSAKTTLFFFLFR